MDQAMAMFALVLKRPVFGTVLVLSVTLVQKPYSSVMTKNCALSQSKMNSEALKHQIKKHLCKSWICTQ